VSAVLSLREDQLLQLVRALGLEDRIQRVYAKTVRGEDGKPKEKTGAKQYIDVLQRHHLETKYGEGVPLLVQKSLQFPHQLPVEATVSQLPYLLRDDRAVELMTGAYQVMLGFDQTTIGVFSRFLSAYDFLPLNHASSLRLPNLPGTVVPFFADAEVVITGAQTLLTNQGMDAKDEHDATSQLLSYTDSEASGAPYEAVFCIRDILWLNGTDIWNWPLYERLKARGRLVGLLRSFGWEVQEPVSAVSGREREFFDYAVQHGGLGVLAKSFGAPYAPGRRVKDWARVRASLVESSTPTAQCYVSSALGTSAVYFRTHLIDPFTGDPCSVRACRLTDLEGGRDDRCADIEFTGWDYDGEYGLQSPRFVRWRDDLKPKGCILNVKRGG
jgi:hypothetical protein